MPPRILPRPAHTVSRKDIDPDALKVLYRLKNHGFVAYLVGGGVRDLLLGRRPKDFDIGTSAHPQQVKRLFRNCFIIGRRFRLCHVRFGRNVVEVSTFRRQAEADEGDTLVRRDNTFGTPEEDAFRRDFTVNALFYDIATFSVIDYVGGLEDLDRRTIRTIGDPAVRLRQGASRRTFEMLHELGLLAYILPAADEAVARRSHELLSSLGRLDEVRRNGRVAVEDLNHALLLGTLLVPLGLPPRGAGARELRRGAPPEEPLDVAAEMASLGAEAEPEPSSATATPLALPF